MGFITQNRNTITTVTRGFKDSIVPNQKYTMMARFPNMGLDTEVTMGSKDVRLVFDKV